MNLRDKSLGFEFEKGRCGGCGEMLNRLGWWQNPDTGEFHCGDTRCGFVFFRADTERTRRFRTMGNSVDS